MTDDARDIIDWEYFEKSRAELGPGFIRILSYFKEDGTKSIAQIEAAMREQNTTALVLPAHTLKGESRQLGAEPLAKVAELIESTARFCIEIAPLSGRAGARGGAAAPPVRPDGRAVRQGHQPADDARRAQRLWPQGQQPGLRPDLVLRRFTLQLDVILDAHSRDHLELLLERVDMLFLIVEDLREQIAADVILDLLAMGDGAAQLG